MFYIPLICEKKYSWLAFAYGLISRLAVLHQKKAAVLTGLLQSQVSLPTLHSGQLLNAQRDLIKDMSKAIKAGKLEIFCSYNRKFPLIFNVFHCGRAGLRQFFLLLSISCIICNHEPDLPALTGRKHLFRRIGIGRLRSWTRWRTVSYKWVNRILLHLQDDTFCFWIGR